MQVKLKVIGGKNDGREIETDVVITDLHSRNGTFINGEPIQGEYIAKVGDILRVARLQFEVLIDVTQPSAKRPKVEDVASVVNRTAEGIRKPSGNLEESISDWLSDDLDAEKSLSDTTQLSLEDTKAIIQEAEKKALQKELEKKSKSDSGVYKNEDSDPGSSSSTGKLPPLPRFSHESSKGAADDVLRKFFNRR